MKKTAKKAKRHASVKPQPVEVSFGIWVQRLFRSLLIGGGVGLGLIFVLSLIAYFTSDPNQLTRPFGILASAITALVGGFAMTRQHRHSALLCGLIMGSLNTALMLLCSLALRSNAAGYSTGISLLLHVGFLLCSVVGAYLGARPQKRKRR